MNRTGEEMATQSDLLRQTLYTSVQLYNILPLTSRCNVKCVFCSHRQNPSGIESFFLPPISREELEDLALFISPERKIVIGESATRIMEGEPFTHPRCLEFLQYIREKFPTTPLQLTTNGTMLTREIVQVLKKLEPLELNLSVNSSSLVMRKHIMNDRSEDAVLQALTFLAEAGITFHGSVVAIPWITGWEDLKNTIQVLDREGASTIRVFLPGYTKYRDSVMEPPLGWEQELTGFIEELRNNIKIPLTLEPAGLKDLVPVITGVIQGSRADAAGLQKGQVILEINGVNPFSRVDAFARLTGKGSYRIKVQEKEGQIKLVELRLEKGEKSGIVMDYDLSNALLREVKVVLEKNHKGKSLLLVSEWGAELLKEGLAKVISQTQGLDYEVITVANTTFGGNIKSAGLLLVEDFQKVLAHYFRQGKKASLVLLPAIAFDHKGRDLKGVFFQELADSFQVKVILLST